MPEPLSTWLAQHSGAIAVIAPISFLLLLASVLATPWVLAKLPANYFSKPPSVKPLSVGRLVMSVIKTILGIIIVLTGMVLMVTPGPGLVCLVLGLVLCEFPGKHSLLRRVIRQPSVFSTLNWLRKKASKPPFLLPAAD